MSLFFDAAWFDARLAERGLDRAALAIAAGLERADLHGVFTNARSATASELETFARVLEADPIEIALRAGVAQREAADTAEPAVRIESIEARLDAIDSWLNEFELKKRA